MSRQRRGDSPEVREKIVPAALDDRAARGGGAVEGFRPASRRLTREGE